ncbi:hypothetical protein D3C71_1904090 [compost metagenome]
MRIDRRFGKRGDRGAHGDDVDFAAGVPDEGRGNVLTQRGARFFRRQMPGTAGRGVIGQRRPRIPGIKNGAVSGKSGKAVGDGALRCGCGGHGGGFWTGIGGF